MRRDVLMIGYYASLLAFIFAVGYCIVQVLQVINVLAYPWADILIYSFSLGIAPPFLIATLSLHYSTPNENKFWSHAALLFAVLYTVFVVLMYTVQLVVAIPLSLHGVSNNLLIVKPQSLFWTIDALGYICMGISTFLASFLFATDKSRSWLRSMLLANGILVPVITFVYFYPHFSIKVLLLASPWVITAPGSMLLLSFYFKKLALTKASTVSHIEVT